MKLQKFRIIADNYNGYECQIWRLWWPFWTQMDCVNSHSSIEKAKKYIENYRNKKVYWQSSHYA